MSEIVKIKFRVTPVVGKDGELYRHMTLMSGFKMEDLTLEDMVHAEMQFMDLWWWFQDE